MHVIAQIPTPTSSELGGWLVGACAVAAIIFLLLGIAVNIKSLRAKQHKPVGARFVTRAELGEKMQVMSDKIGGVQQSLDVKLTELRDYTHNSIHELRNSLQSMQLSQERMHREVAKEIASGTTALSGKVDSLKDTVVSIQAFLDAKLKFPNPAEPKKPG